MSHCSCKFVSQQMPFPDETNAVCSGGWANKIHHAVFKLDTYCLQNTCQCMQGAQHSLIQHLSICAQSCWAETMYTVHTRKAHIQSKVSDLEFTASFF